MLGIGGRELSAQPFAKGKSGVHALLWAALGLAVVGWAAPSRAGDILDESALVCPRVDVELQDGRVPAEAWEEAAEFKLVLTGTGTAPEYQTTGRVMFDDDHLYVQTINVAPDRLSRPPRLARNERVSHRHDHLQFFLAPGPAPDQFYRMDVDRAGNLRDSHHRRDGETAQGLDWNPDWPLHVDEVEGGWRAEFVLPFSIFGAETPQRGDLWRFKLGRYGENLPITMWPLNRIGQFGPPETDGALYFESANILLGADFAEAPLGRDAPPHWSVSRPPEGGDVHVVEDADAVGGRALHYVKATVEDHRPQVWSRGHELAEGGVYALSASLRGDIPNMNLRMDTRIEGTRYRSGSGKQPTAHYQRYTFQFVVPRGAGVVNVGFSPGTPVAGEAWIDDVVLMRLFDDVVSADDVPEFVPPDFSLDPDPVQGLDAFMGRAGVKPWDRFQCPDGEGIKTYRVIFNDRKYGTEIWLMDNSHTPEGDPGASVWQCWNADASTLYLGGRRYLGDDLHRGWFFNPDFSRLLPAAARPVWDREDPDLYFNPISPRGSVTRFNRRTGESKVLAEWRRHPRERLYGMTRDNKHAFVDVVNGGIWVPYEPDENLPIPRMGLHDGRPALPDNTVFTAGRASTANVSPWGHLFRIRVGKYVCKETGETQRAILPLCGETNYLKTFKSGRVQFPRGEQWEGYAMDRDWDDVPVPTGKSVDELYEMFRNLPFMTHGHESVSADGVFYARDGGNTVIWRMREGVRETTLNVSSSGHNYHLHWKNHPNYLVAWIRAWVGMAHGPFSRPENAGLIYQGFADGTWQPVLETKHRFTPARRCSYEMLSPDATKVHFASTMTGRSKNYVAVLARPRPPVGIEWEERGGAVQLRWQPPVSAREIKGYLVYRSDRSGEGYELMTPEAVDGLEWVDRAVQPGRAYFYAVTSLEHSRLESGYSAEAAGAGVGLAGPLRQPVRMYVEAEHAIFDLPYSQVQTGLALGRDRLGASNWFYAYRHPDADEGRAGLDVNIPADGAYYVWARVRSSNRAEANWSISLGGLLADAGTSESEWAWMRAEPAPMALRAGALELAFSTGDAGAELDALCLTTDATYRPEGPRVETPPAPRTVSNLRVADVEGRVVQLAWDYGDDPHFSHFNVYSAREPFEELGQERLIGSPTYGEFVDWGLRAGAEYHYAVTAVNRRGAEGEPAMFSAATPPREVASFEAELAFDQGDRKGRFAEGDADGLRSGRFLVPLEPEANEVSWSITVPEDTVAYLWLRYLPGLDPRMSRRVAVRQNVHVSLNGRRLDTLDSPTAINVPDNFLTKEGNPLAPHFWTWHAPVRHQLEGVRLPAGEHTLAVSNLAAQVRYDVLYLTNEPSFQPECGRLRQ